MLFVTTDEMPNVRLYTQAAEMSFSQSGAYVGKSKNIRYEIPCGFTGAAKHTGLKAEPTDICKDRNIGTWKGQNME